MLTYYEVSCHYNFMNSAIMISIMALAALSVFSTYYKYIVLRDFSYDVKPVEEFTENDF